LKVYALAGRYRGPRPFAYETTIKELKGQWDEDLWLVERDVEKQPSKN